MSTIVDNTLKLIFVVIIFTHIISIMNENNKKSRDNSRIFHYD